MTTQPNERSGGSGGFVAGSGTPGSSYDREAWDDAGMVGHVQSKAEDLASRAGERARSRFDDGKHRAAQELGSVAHALRECGTHMNGDRSTLLAPYVNQAAEQVDRISHFIDTHSPEDIAHNVERFARKNPAVFLGGCFAIGMLAARFLKSSRSEVPVRYGLQERTPDHTGYSTQTTAMYGSSTGYTDSARDTGLPETSSRFRNQ